MRASRFIAPLFGLALTVLLTPNAAADILYTYTGPTYTNCFGSYSNSGPCAATYSLTGSLDTSLSLAQLENGGAGLTDFALPSADIVSVSLSDGFLASLSLSTAVTDVVEISTNGSGDITSWAIYLADVTPAANTMVTGETLATYSTSIAPINADVSGNEVNTICGAVTNPPNGCNFSVTSGGDDVNALETEGSGTWSAPVSVPEPAGWVLLTTGLVAVSLRARAWR
jgi:hypothetical protein